MSTADGARFPAYEAHPGRPSTRGVIILPDVRGAHAYYQALAVRFAETGIHAVVVDYYGHLTDDMDRGDGFQWEPRLPDVDADSVRLVVAAAIDELRGHGVEDVFSVGFCFGGSHSWLLSASGLPLRGVVGFYGNPDLVEPRIPELRLPLLLLVAGNDVATSRERSDDFERQLTLACVPHRQRVYDGAAHSFFDRSSAQWTAECEDAGRQVLAFLAEPPAATTVGHVRAAAYSRLDDFLPAPPELAREFAHGTIATRPGLHPDQRELVILGALIAVGDSGLQLDAHARRALELGITGPQLGEIVLQTIPYAGFPRAINAALALGAHIGDTTGQASEG